MSDWIHGLPLGWMAVVILGGTYLVTAAIYALVMRLAQDAVWREKGVWLRPEIELVCRWSEAQRAALREPVR